MARILNNSVYAVDDSPSSRSFNNPEWQMGDSSVSNNLENQEGSTESLRSKIERSEIYQQAYALFSKAQDKIWLQRLESIVGSVVGANSTWLDDIGLSNKYKDKMQSIEAEAYNQIQKLISEYQSYKQDLPITQVQDMADAGINSAITGNGIDGASISGDASQRDMSPYQMESTNPLESISTIGNLLFSASDGILSAIQVFNQIGVSRKSLNLQSETLELSKRSQFANLQKMLFEQGFSSAPFGSTVEDFDQWWKEHGMQESIDLNIGPNFEKKVRSAIQHAHAGSVLSHFYDDDGEGWIQSEEGAKLVNEMVDFQINTWQKTIEYKNAYAEYMSLYQSTLDPERLANLKMDTETLQKEILSKQKKAQDLANELTSLRNNSIDEWVKTAGTNRQARAILARVLMNVSASESVQLNDFSAFSNIQQLNNYISPIGAVTGAISNLPAL